MKLYMLYLARQLALPTLLSTLAFAGAVWLSQSLRFVDLIVNKGVPLTVFLRLTLLLLPSLLLVVLPYALFCALLFVLHRLILESELTVLRAAGLSNLQLAGPCLLIAGVVTLASYAISLYFMPLAFREFRDLQLELRRDFSYLLLQPKVFNSPAPGVTIYVRDQNDDGTLTGILVHDARQKRLPTTMMASEGMLVQGDEGPLFVMESGSRQELNARAAADPILSILHFDKYTLDLVSAQAAPERPDRKLKELYLPELLAPDPRNTTEIRQRSMIAEGHKRLTWPLTPLVFALIALAALLARPYERRSPWRTILSAVIAAIAFQTLTMAAASLATRSLAALPLLYVVPVGTTAATVAIFVLARRSPQLALPR